MNTENFTEEFNHAIEEWRSKNGIDEKDAVLLLLDLFRIHQKHWDAIRHQEMPAFAEYRQSISSLEKTAQEYRTLSGGLMQELQDLKSYKKTLWMLCLPVGSVVILGLIFGIIIGKYWI